MKADELARREELVDEKAKEFLEAVGAGEKESIGRVLYLRDISDISWVRNTYVGFEAAPVSVMYGNVDVQTFQGQDIKKAIEEAHAGFLYVDKLAGNGKELFEAFTGSEEFEYGCLYKIINESEGMRLLKV